MIKASLMLLLLLTGCAAPPERKAVAPKAETEARPVPTLTVQVQAIDQDFRLPKAYVEPCRGRRLFLPDPGTPIPEERWHQVLADATRALQACRNKQQRSIELIKRMAGIIRGQTGHR